MAQGVKNRLIFGCLFLAFSWVIVKAQTVEPTDSVVVDQAEASDSLQAEPGFFQRNPTKAALYSAVLPGMGQLYNKKYWKVPLVWGVLGAGAGFIIYFNDQYKAGRQAYLNLLNGQPVDPRFANASIEALANYQDDQRRYRDYSIALTALAYVLNVMDAAVDAHLLDIKNDPDLSFEPVIIQNPTNQMDMKAGLAVRLRF